MNCRKRSGKDCSKHRKHTPIVSQAQKGMFGADMARREKGMKPMMKGIAMSELEGHLKESKGKHLPKRSHQQ